MREAVEMRETAKGAAARAWPRPLLLAAAAAAAAALRLACIGWGLPAVYNADEPHLVNLAVSFGGGSLKPAFFKYPTLWPYLLFFCYGVYFAAWSGAGRLHGLGEFIGLYAWQPSGFYLIGRLLSAALGLAALLVLARTERDRCPGAIPWAALLLAFSPVLVELCHAAKPDCLMLFFICGAWHFLLKLYRDGGRRAHWACGLCLGLAMSSQYTAVLVPLAAILAHFLSPARPPRRWLWEGLCAAAAGFLAGSPYVLLDFPNFWASMRDLNDLAGLEAWSRLATTWRVLGNVWNFAGPWSLAGAGLVLGAARLWRCERRLAVVFLVPIVAYVLALGNNPDGAWPRYLLAAFPGLALLAAEGLSWLEALLAGRWARACILAAALGPGLLSSAAYDRELALPDTRRQATQWLERNVPPGAAVLLDLPHASPSLAMTRGQVEELWERTRRAGSPRARLYRGMADAHPGGGWRVYRVRRSAKDLRSSPRHVRLSQADAAILDVEPGLGAALAAGVEYVVVSSYGATPERAPQLAAFWAGLERRAALLAEFGPVPGRVMGPRLRIYRLAR